MLIDIPVVPHQGQYLGLPTYIGRNKREVFHFIKDRIWKRLNSWNSKLLSRGGKEILLKTVVQAIPNYVMNIFLLPVSLCEEIERMLNCYWWGRNSLRKGNCWLN